MARWIDDLAVEQVDTDGDGTLDATLYPITDLLGSVQLLTDESGTPVERITYEPDGTPHFWSANTTRPSVTRLAWTGDGTLSTGDTVTPHAFELGFSEPIDPAGASNATATLTPDGGNAVALTLTLAADGRAAYLTGATVAAGTQYTLHVEGLTDTSHNPIWPLDTTVTVSDVGTYEVLTDTTPPQLLAIFDGNDALYLLFDESVIPEAGFSLADTITLTRQGQPVDGTATRTASNLLQWTPADLTTYPAGASFTLTLAHLTDLAGNSATTATTTFTHLTTTPDLLHLAYTAPGDSQPETQSAYGLTTLFQGRTWHPDLGMYYYRARWYLPEMGEFAERDPMSYRESSNLTQTLGYSFSNILDPLGLGALVPPEAQPPILFPFTSEKEETPDLPLDPSQGPLLLPGGTRPTIRANNWRGSAPTSLQRNLAEDLLHAIEKTVGSDPTDAFIVNFLLDQAERHHGSSGISFEAMGAHMIAGAHVGLNFQIFYNQGSYSAGLYFFETLSTPLTYIFEGGPKYEHEYEKLTGPFGVLGESVGADVGVNVAVAGSAEENSPDKWTRYFNTLSASATIPIYGVPVPVGVSYFWSDAFKGAEVALAPGGGGAYTRPFFHMLGQKRVDRQTVESVYRIYLGAARWVF